MLRQFLLKHEDRVPALFNWARYVRHVVIARNMTYPDLLGPIFSELGASRLGAIDVGANTGIFTRYLSRRFARTLAIEPHGHLARRLGAIDPARVTPINSAAGANEGRLVLRTPIDKHGRPMPALATASVDNNFELFGKEGTVETEVAVHRLDNLVADMPAIGFIKIDVEGFEEAVVQGAEALLKRDQPLVMVEICRAHNPNYESFITRLEGLGFTGYSVRRDGLCDSMRADIARQPLHIETVSAPGSDALDCDFLFVSQARRKQVARFLIAS